MEIFKHFDKDQKKTDVLSLMGPLKVEIIKFSLKFRAIFENVEKDQKKTDIFNLVVPLKEGFWGR